MMTDNERQRMCADLRRCKSSWLEDVADEIERLAAENDTLIGQLAATTTLYNNLYNRMTVMSGNVRLVEELEDGAIFEVGPGVRND